MADITTSDGTQIDRNFLNGKRNEVYRSVLMWPHQEDIYKKGGIIWERFLRNALCTKGTDFLTHPLGQWLKGNGHNSWKFFQHPTTNWLYEQRKVNGNHKWFRYGPTPENKKVLNRDAGLPCTAPQNAFRVSLRSSSLSTWVIHGSGWQPMPTNSRVPSTPLGNPTDLFLQRLLGQGYKAVFRDERKMRKLVDSISGATALAGSDGSMIDGKMTLGWVLKTVEGAKCQISGLGMVDKDGDTNDSTRAERGGRVAILAILVHVVKSFDLNQGHVTILIDNQQALRYGTSPRQGDGPFKHLADDYDLKCWASLFENDLKHNHNILLNYQHVYSNQDNPHKLMKIQPEINIIQAIHMANNPSVHA